MILIGFTLSSTPPNKYFCHRAFDHIFGEGGRDWKLCCRANASEQYEFSDYTLDEYSPEEWFFSDFMENVRRWMLRGEDPHGVLAETCKHCHNNEKDGVESDRQFRWRRSLWDVDESWTHTKTKRPDGIKFKNLYDSIENFKEGKTWKESLTGRPLELKINIIGNYCNFSCFACQPKNSSTRENELKKLGIYSDDNYNGGPAHMTWGGLVKDPKIQGQIDSLLPHTRQIFFQGGEPLLTKDHLDIIEKALGHELEVQYATNLSRISQDVLDAWKKCHVVKLNISIDGYGKEAEYSRWGLKWDKFVNNFKKVRPVVQKLELSYTTSIVNVMNIGTHYKNFMSDPLFKDCYFNCQSSIVVNPKFLGITSMPRELREIAYDRIKGIEKLSNVATALISERDTSHLFPFAINYIKKLDESRKVSILEYVPEFEKYFSL